MDKLRPAWEECDCCGDFICNVHPGEHVADCTCPSIEDWAEADMFPYTELATAKVIEWVEKNPFKEE